MTAQPRTTAEIRLPVLTGALVVIVAVAAFESTSTSALLPTITAEIGGRSTYALVFGLFTLAELVALVIGARVCDTMGPVRSLQSGAALHLAGLLAAGTAPEFGWLLGGRVLQGAGSGLVTVSVYVLIAQCYTDRERAGIFAVMASAWAIPGLLGPVAGGALAQAWDWRAVFLAIPVFEVVALIAVWPTLRVIERRSVRRPATEPVGRRLLAVALLAAGVVTIMSLRLLPTDLAWPVLGVSIVVVVVGVRPLLPAGALRMASGLPAGIMLRGFVAGFFFGAQFLVPLALIEGRGYSVAGAGLALSCSVVGFSVGGLLQGRDLVRRLRFTVLMRISLGLLTVGMAATAVGLSPGFPSVLAYVGWGIAGLGLGSGITALNVFVLDQAEPARRGSASAAMRITDSVGNAVMVAIAGLVLATSGGTGRPAADAAVLVIGCFAGGMLVTMLLTRRLRVVEQ
ncbi:MFS transporter [Actinokineospora sp.]|uniref:MFS transporter n=1 Tax=Actinokineospora sp. TaxID=1872133 RepID=UPI0040381175